jgi:hypothetical protein
MSTSSREGRISANGCDPRKSPVGEQGEKAGSEKRQAGGQSRTRRLPLCRSTTSRSACSERACCSARARAPLAISIVSCVPASRRVAASCRRSCRGRGPTGSALQAWLGVDRRLQRPRRGFRPRVESTAIARPRAPPMWAWTTDITPVPPSSAHSSAVPTGGTVSSMSISRTVPRTATTRPRTLIGVVVVMPGSRSTQRLRACRSHLPVKSRPVRLSRHQCREGPIVPPRARRDDCARQRVRPLTARPAKSLRAAEQRLHSHMSQQSTTLTVAHPRHG